ncbi:MAG TPA: hypothetical protein VFM52_04555, partial [Rhodanobacter sp.]|nr:hypothetical protein [Rhodanobacter sp.]
MRARDQSTLENGIGAFPVRLGVARFGMRCRHVGRGGPPSGLLLDVTEAHQHVALADPIADIHRQLEHARIGL